MIEYLKNVKETYKESISVGFFYEFCNKHFGLELIAKNKGFNKKIKNRNIHRPGLALAGYVELFTFDRVQVFGNTEIAFLNGLTKTERRKTLKRYFKFDIPCIIITNNKEVDELIIEYAKINNVSIFRTNLSTTKTIYDIGDFLDDQFSARASVHGSFVDVYGIGLLILGKSGIGKSEVALDLVERGHRLVADDLVIVTRKGDGILLGSATEISKHFMEIRGVGLINVHKMFGVRSIRYQKRIEVIVILEEFDKNNDYTRTGLETKETNLLGVGIQTVILPIFPGKNITVIAEVIALNYLLKHYGYNPATEIQKRIKKAQIDKIKTKKTNDLRAVHYFEHDYE